MPADPKAVGSALSRAGSALATAAPVLAVASGPFGAAAGILGALAALAGDVVAGQQVPITRADDPGPMLEAMRARWAAKRAARSTP